MPNRPPKFFGAILTILAIGTFSFFILFLRFTAPPKPVTDNSVQTEDVTRKEKLKPTTTIADPTVGPPTAKVTIVEFADYRCPHCDITNLELKKITEAYPQEVRLVWKDFPFLPPLDLTWQAHESARCAENQGKFWEFHDALFANQTAFNRDLFLNIAKTLNLDLTKFQSCLDSGETKALVNRTFEEGKNLGVSGTPYIFINGTVYDGEITLDTIKQFIK